MVYYRCPMAFAAGDEHDVPLMKEVSIARIEVIGTL
jgi:hypothetical protein